MPENSPPEMRSDARPEFRPDTAPRSGWPGGALAVLLCMAAVAALWWFWLRPAPAPAPAAAPPEAAAAPAPSEAAMPAPAAASAPLHPLAAPVDSALPPLAESDAMVSKTLAELWGAERVAASLITEGFIRRTVATVDNLARSQAPARMWPVQPMPERFTVQSQGDGLLRIAPANAARYRAALALAEAVPVEAAVAFYVRLYPLFQQSYVELGYPQHYFNDRLVAVLDHLLQAPTPPDAPAVQLLPVTTQVPNLRPWVRYEFVDPALQSLSSGQKIMVRMGPENAARAKAVLRQLRERVASPGAVGKP